MHGFAGFWVVGLFIWTCFILEGVFWVMAESWIWQVGDAGYSLDLLDGAVLARYRAAVTGLAGADGGADGDVIGGLCAGLRGFFDALFGEGAGARIVGAGDDLRGAMGVYGDFLAFVAGQARDVRAMVADAMARYDPGCVPGEADAGEGDGGDA